MRLQAHNSDFLLPLNELNTKLLELELTESSSHCCTCKFKFPLQATKSQTDYIERFVHKSTLRKTSSYNSHSPKKQIKSKKCKNKYHSRMVSSDPQIAKTRDLELKSGCLNQLERDLAFIKDQFLCDLNKNKSFITSVIKELQLSYQNLLQRNEEQEREIEILKNENRILSVNLDSDSQLLACLQDSESEFDSLPPPLVDQIEEIREKYQEIASRQDSIESKLRTFEEKPPVILCPQSITINQSVYTVGNTTNFDDLIQTLYDEINKTWTQNQEIQDRYKDLCLQEKQSQIDDEFQGRTDVVCPYCAGVHDYKSDYELECVCEPCED
ncbi:uncharacterized protein LOC123012360 [Tribolium madens]|uniref:uncharacterized protein LOC123012360 n=1 Tax=Tribolium madens TaxID=41895 RepID=UPI001CF763EA|nr:uncharacterized protein LOC123012360 [Tribolium madens]